MLTNYTSESNYSYSKHFMTTESSNQPYLSYTYNPITYTALSNGVKVNGNITQAGEYWYKFTAPECRSYAFYTSGTTDTYGELYQGTTLLIQNDDSANDYNFCIVHDLVQGIEYRLKVRGFYLSTTGSYTVAVNGHWAQCLTNSNTSINSGLNRSTARDYMEEWHDDFNPDYEQQGGDCANFASQCLFAGGLGFTGAPTSNNEAKEFENDPAHWYYCPQYDHWTLLPPSHIRGFSQTWTAVANFRWFWGKKQNGSIGKCYQYTEYSSQSDCLKDIAYLANTLNPGDILQYTGPENHTMLVSDTVTTIGSKDVLFSGHTNPRFDDSFKTLVLKSSQFSGCHFVIIRINQFD